MSDSLITDEILEAVVATQKTVAAFQMKHFRNLPSQSVSEKEAKELVTKIDVESEEMLKEKLLKLIPNSSFLGEESGRSGASEHLWIVDPIDGTTNYVHGIDQFCISVGLLQGSDLALGSIYKPPGQEVFTAIRGKGAKYNNQTLPVHKPKDFASSLVATGFPYRSKANQSNFFQCAEQVLEESRGIRRFGAAALDLAYVACGFFQGFWETDLQSYDVAAALLLLEETGCRYSQFNGEKYDLLSNNTIVAGIPTVYDRLQQLTQKFYC